MNTGEPGFSVTSAELEELITTSSVSVGFGEVHHQVAITWDGDWSTLRNAAPYGAGEHTPTTTDLWTSSKALGVFAANEPAPLGDIIAQLDALGDIRYSGFGVLAYGVPSEVHSISWEGQTFTFGVAPSYPELTSGNQGGVEGSWSGSTFTISYPAPASATEVTLVSYGDEITVIGTVPAVAPHQIVVEFTEAELEALAETPAVFALLDAGEWQLLGWVETTGPEPAADTGPGAPFEDETGFTAENKGSVEVSVDHTGKATITVAGLNEGDTGHVYAYSTPQYLGAFTATTDGVLTVDLSGLSAEPHILAVVDEDGVLYGWAQVDLTELVATGADIGGYLTVGALLLAALVVILGYDIQRKPGRRRKVAAHRA